MYILRQISLDTVKHLAYIATRERRHLAATERRVSVNASTSNVANRDGEQERVGAAWRLPRSPARPKPGKDALMSPMTFKECVATELHIAHLNHPDPHSQETAASAFDLYAHRVRDLIPQRGHANRGELLAWRLIQVAGLCERLAQELALPTPDPDTRP